jgi:hypothetical protein
MKIGQKLTVNSWQSFKTKLVCKRISDQPHMALDTLSFIDEMKQLDISEHIVAQIVGHANLY